MVLNIFLLSTNYILDILSCNGAFFKSHFSCVRASVKTQKMLTVWHMETKRNLPFTKNALFVSSPLFPPSLPIPQLSLEFQMPEPVCTVSPFEIHGREIVSWPSKL